MAVYLLHFERPYKHAKHYLGYAKGGAAGVERRVSLHRKGQGARLVAVAAAAGIGFEVARVWPDADRAHERKLKARKEAPRLCPICQEAKLDAASARRVS